MKRKTFSKRKMGIGLFVAFLLFIGAFNASVTKSQDATKNLIASHDSASPKYDKNCTNCHADILTQISLNPSILNSHAAMLPYTPGKENNKKCIWCHRTVDLVQGTTRVEKSKSNLRKGVNMDLCAVCHSPSGPGPQFFQVELTPTDGASLYELMCAACHRDLANSQVKGKTPSQIQKAINVNKGGMGPFKVLSTEEIQAIAAVLAK